MKKRLDYIALQYEYPDRGKQLYRQVIPLQPLLQQNYGEALDCTITSLACIFGERYYGVIESIARRYGYDGERCGTNPLTVRRIMADFMKKQHMTGKARSGYGKGISWRWVTVKRLIARQTPVILNLWDDGRGYYHDHTVTVIGVEEYRKDRFLLVLDNWNESISLIDYKKLSIISSINWVDM